MEKSINIQVDNIDNLEIEELKLEVSGNQNNIYIFNKEAIQKAKVKKWDWVKVNVEEAMKWHYNSNKIKNVYNRVNDGIFTYTYDGTKTDKLINENDNYITNTEIVFYDWYVWKRV